MKRGWVVVLVLLLIASIRVYIWYKRAWDERIVEGGPNGDTLKPRLEVGQMNITGISDETIDMTMKLLIDNPLPVGFKANQLDHIVYIADTP